MSNISDNKRIAKNTFFLYTRMALVLVVSLFTSRIVLQQLGVEDFGIYNVIGGFVGLFVAFTNCLSNAINRFYTCELGSGTPLSIKRVFSTCVISNLVLSLFIAIVMEIVGTWALENKLVIPEARMEAAHIVLHTSIVTLFFNLLVSPLNAAVMAHEKMKLYAYMSLTDVLGKLAIALYLMWASSDKLVVYGFLQIGFSFLYFIVVSFYCSVKVPNSRISLWVDTTLVKDLSKYSTWMIMGQLANVSVTYGYNILLNIFFGPIVNTARGISVQVQNAIQQFSSNIQVSIRPQLMKNYASGNYNRTEELVYAGPRYCFYMMYTLALPIAITAPYLLQLWLGIVPDFAVIFTRFIVIIMCFDNLSFSLMMAMEAKGSIQNVSMLTCLLCLSSLIVIYVLFENGAPPYALYIVFGTLVIVNLMARISIISRMLNYRIMTFYRKALLPVFAVFLSSSVLPLFIYILLGLNDFLSFMTLVMVSIFSVLCISFFLGLSKTERSFIIEKTRHLYQKVRHQ